MSECAVCERLWGRGGLNPPTPCARAVATVVDYEPSPHTRRPAESRTDRLYQQALELQVRCVWALTAGAAGPVVVCAVCASSASMRGAHSKRSLAVTP